MSISFFVSQRSPNIYFQICSYIYIYIYIQKITLHRMKQFKITVYIKNTHQKYKSTFQNIHVLRIRKNERHRTVSNYFQYVNNLKTELCYISSFHSSYFIFLYILYNLYICVILAVSIHITCMINMIYPRFN